VTSFNETFIHYNNLSDLSLMWPDFRVQHAGFTIDLPIRQEEFVCRMTIYHFCCFYLYLEIGLSKMVDTTIIYQRVKLHSKYGTASFSH